MSHPSPEQVEVALQSFFDEGNECVRSDIQQHPEYGEWVANLEKPVWTMVVLPRRINGLLTWYVCCTNAQDARRCSRLLRAYVGPSYAQFSGRRCELNPDDPPEAALLPICHGFAFRVPIHAKDEEGALLAVGRLRRMLTQAPSRSLAIPMSTTDLVSGLYSSLHTYNRPEAEAILAKIEKEGRLRALNQAFLRIRLHQRWQEWDAILGMGALDAVVQAYRPRKITEAVIQALFHRINMGEGFGPSPASAIAAFEAGIPQHYLKLFGSSGFVEFAETARLFLIHWANDGCIDPGVVTRRQSEGNRLLGLIGQSADDWGLYQALYDRICDQEEQEEAPEEIEPIEAESDDERVRTLLEAGRWDDALTVLERMPPSVETARSAIACAAEIGSNHASGVAGQIMDALEAPLRRQVLESRNTRLAWEYLQGSIGDDSEMETLPAEQLSVESPLAPSNWNEWCECLLDSEQFSHAAAVASAESGSVEWDVEGYVNDLERCKSLAASLTDLDNVRQTTLNQCIPNLLDFLSGVANPTDGIAGIHRTLFEVIATRVRRSSDDRLLILEIASWELAHHATDDRYRMLIGVFGDLWEECKDSASNLGWALEVLDLLVDFGGPDPRLRVGFLEQVLPEFHRFHRRVRRHEWLILEQLCGELGAPERWDAIAESVGGSRTTEEAELADAPSEILQGQTVAIYTLTESAGRRAKGIIESEYTGVRVETCHDKQTTVRLKHLARTSDIFIVTTWSAKHAATYGISSHRPSHLPVLYPTGKGSSSIVAVLNNHLNAQSVERQ